MIYPMTFPKVTPPEFMTWLDKELTEGDLADSDASKRAGLSHSAIYEIRGGMRPGVKKCKALARFFGYPEEYVLRLAGHLPPEPTFDADDERMRARIGQIAETLSKLPPDLRDQQSDQILVQVQLALAAYQAGQPKTEKPHKEPEEKPDNEPA